ncbi:nascent polypeptide-associated complex protein [archaeon]|jgi:nascent polypeptide-associated complex subunit alpha|nr:nascent polypeptide-associated complex protein [archaeon]MBT6697721.1 nascent polypeptide-associated complex protein [archaeon]
MFPGVNPRQMQKMMSKMGMKQVDLQARRVIIELEDRKLVFEQPSIQKVNMMGQESFQLTGSYSEESYDDTPDVSDDDIEVVIAQTGVSRDRAIEAINVSKGDLAEAIMTLSSEKEEKSE